MVKATEVSKYASQKQALTIPQVSKKDLENAKKALESEKQKIKARASMHYWLEKEGVKKLYDKKGMDYKRVFLEKWLPS